MEFKLRRDNYNNDRCLFICIFIYLFIPMYIYLSVRNALPMIPRSESSQAIMYT